MGKRWFGSRERKDRDPPFSTNRGQLVLRWIQFESDSHATCLQLQQHIRIFHIENQHLTIDLTSDGACTATDPFDPREWPCINHSIARRFEVRFFSHSVPDVPNVGSIDGIESHPQLAGRGAVGSGSFSVQRLD